MKKFALMSFAIAALAAAAQAHDGRRMEIKIVDNRLVAHGYVSNGVDDGGGIVRPYYNAIHGHWANDPSPGVTGASADLPGFDLFDAGTLSGHSLELTLIGAAKWMNPPAPMALDGHVVPDLQPLTPAEEIFVSFDGEFVSTEAPGTLVVSSSVPPGGLPDLDLSYDTLTEPSGVIYVLEFELSTDAPGVMPSETVHVLLSPEGATPAIALHHASLHLERFLGARVCDGDATGDLRTDVGDLNAILGAWGSDVGAASFIDLANDDGVIDVNDLNRVLGDWGADCS